MPWSRSHKMYRREFTSFSTPQEVREGPEINVHFNVGQLSTTSGAGAGSVTRCGLVAWLSYTLDGGRAH